MFYFTSKSIVNAFLGCKDKTLNKFWGLVAILNSIDENIVPAKRYSFSTAKVSTFLEDLFWLDDSKKKYDTDAQWSILFSTGWLINMPSQMFKSNSVPNIVDIAVWGLRNKAFDDVPTVGEIISRFLTIVKMSEEEARSIFDFSPKEIEFNESLVTEKDLLAEIESRVDTPNPSSLKTVTFEETFIRKNPGALQAAPFIQTLYSGQGVQKCLILTQFDFDELYPRSANNYQSLTNMPDIPTQQIFYGTPGSGKSYKVKEITDNYPDDTFRTTFHPDTDYASFVGCYKPVMEGKDIVYKFQPQAFTNAYVRAWNNLEKPVFLVIEEINRGNCAQIFGDLFQLLDRKDEKGHEESVYPIVADMDLQKYLRSNMVDKDGKETTEKILKSLNGLTEKGEIKLPPNLYILATMNTSDQSLFPMDSAFKRRWAWEYVPICYAETVKDGKENKAFHYRIDIGTRKYRWIQFLRIANCMIKGVTDSEDKQMGNFFIKHNVKEGEFVSKVMYYLWSEVCKEEYGTENNFFRAKQGDELTEFSFNELFENGGTDKLIGFMDYLQQQADGKLKDLGIKLELDKTTLDIADSTEE